MKNKILLPLLFFFFAVTIHAQPPNLTNSGNQSNLCANSTVWVTAFWDNGYGYGSYQNGYGGWSTSGSGSWNPIGNQYSPMLNKLANNAGYVPSAADVSNGSVTLTFTVEYNGNYKQTSLTLSFASTPTVSAGPDATIDYCLGTDSITLTGSVSGASSYYWSVNSGQINFDNAYNLNTVYHPDYDDVQNGIVHIELTGNNSCGSFRDTLILTIDHPEINAGMDQEICSETDSIQLAGSAQFTNSTAWRTTGTGTFSDTLSLNTRYAPGTDELNTGKAQLVLYSNQNGNCFGFHDTITITFHDYVSKVINASFFPGDTFTFLGKNYTQAGSYNDTLIVLNSCDSAFTINLTEKSNVGIEDHTSGNFKIYPNPVHDLLFVELAEPANLEIYNITGTLVHQNQATLQHRVDVTSYPIGLYLIKVNHQVIKFIKN